MLDAKFWAGLGIDTVACYRKHIFGTTSKGRDAKDIYGKPYDRYNQKYEQRKQSGSLFRQSKEYKESRSPVLTSDLLRDFKAFKSHKTGFGFGAIAQRGKIEKLAKMGRVLYTKSKVLPDECEKFVMKELTKDVKGAFKKIRRKIRRKKINININ